MASANVKELTDANFDAEVLKSDVPTLVDFWAVWCGPCKQIAPTVDALADEYKGRLKVAKMDVDHHQIVGLEARAHAEARTMRAHGPSDQFLRR